MGLYEVPLSMSSFACTSCGQQKEPLLRTYKAVGRSIINYGAPVWSINLRETNYINIPYKQYEALYYFTGVLFFILCTFPFFRKYTLHVCYVFNVI